MTPPSKLKPRTAKLTIPHSSMVHAISIGASQVAAAGLVPALHLYVFARFFVAALRSDLITPSPWRIVFACSRLLHEQYAGAET